MFEKKKKSLFSGSWHFLNIDLPDLCMLGTELHYFPGWRSRQTTSKAICDTFVKEQQLDSLGRNPQTGLKRTIAILFFDISKFERNITSD